MNSNIILEIGLTSYASTAHNIIIENLLWIAVGFILYALISTFVIRPYAIRKSRKVIGGNVEIKSDPLLIMLPIIIIIAFTTSWILDSYY
jgi:hypothetical protein